MSRFTVYPAIDLRNGKVVRLKEGDPARQTNYSDEPAETARGWLKAGAKWLHVVNLDGAFGDSSDTNIEALKAILEVADTYGANIQFGGGIRSVKNVETILGLGVNRVILGTLAIEQPEAFDEALDRFGTQRIAISLDARDGMVQVHGWQTTTTQSAVDTAKALKEKGLDWLVFTDISRDGLQSGINLKATIELAQASKLNVIASGGVRGWEDIQGAYEARLPGLIVGRALYEGVFDPVSLFSYPQIISTDERKV